MRTGRRVGLAALALAGLVLLTGGCASGGARRAAAEPAAAELDEARFAIAKVIADTARAVTDFSKAPDPKTVLRFYAADYDGVQDGDRQTLKDVERLLGELRDRIESGDPIQMAARTTNIRVEMATPTVGWASYDLLFSIGAGARSAQQAARCTGLYRKVADAWVVRHEHCSTRRPGRMPG
jgi:ketosteroid isomerase-like protein